MMPDPAAAARPTTQAQPSGRNLLVRNTAGGRIETVTVAPGEETRVRPGLPPGPIGNPGLASLEAAAHPARGGFLYYVVKPGTCGRHAFSTPYAQFLRDQARYEAARRANGGRSPTSC
jgi:hypothetical protein